MGNISQHKPSTKTSYTDDLDPFWDVDPSPSCSEQPLPLYIVYSFYIWSLCTYCTTDQCIDNTTRNQAHITGYWYPLCNM